MDNRKIRTKARIKEACITCLMKSKSSKVTVSDICKIADINRSTFYEYYEYIDKLINEVIGDQLKEIFNYNDKIYDKYHMDHYTSAEECEKYLLNFSSNDIIKKLITSSNSAHYKSLIISITYNYELNKYHIVDEERQAQILYRNNGVFAVLFYWIEHDIDIKKVSEFLYKQIVNGNVNNE